MNNNSNNSPQNEFSDDAMELRLWDYLDGTSHEPAAIERLLAENARWKAKYAELLDIHQLVNATELDQPSLRFTKNVMEEIAKTQIAPAAKKYINKKIIWGIAAFFATVIASFLGYGFSQVKWSNGNSTSNPLGVDISNFDFRVLFSNGFVNLFLMLNVMLGLLLLDQYLNWKKKKLINR